MDHLWRDLENLAGRLPHRGGITENERHAAEYLLERFEEHCPLAHIEDFHSIDAYPYLFAMYYAEFIFVALFASVFPWPWVPWAMLVYGVGVFLMYMAEITGYSVMSRFLPQFETQNVLARQPCADAERLLIVTAHYDSPKAMPWTQPGPAGSLRWMHVMLVVSMVVVLISCGAEGLGVFANWEFRPDWIARWMAAGVLLAAAAALYTGARRAEFTPGANNNASGTAAILALAQRLREHPLGSTEVWFLATGSKEMWLSGMRHFFLGLDVDRDSTYFLNVDGVGRGALRYLTGEGMLHVYKASGALTRSAEAAAAEFGARPFVYHGPPTDALIPLARGHHAMTVMATEEDGRPAEWNRQTDTVSKLDLNTLERAAEFIEAIARKLDAAA